MTWHVATNHINAPHVTSQPTTLLHLTPQLTSWHHITHHHHGTPERRCAQKTRFGHRTGSSPCAHAIGKFCLWFIVLSFWNFRPRLDRELLVLWIAFTYHMLTCFCVRNCSALDWRLRFHSTWIGSSSTTEEMTIWPHKSTTCYNCSWQPNEFGIVVLWASISMEKIPVRNSLSTCQSPLPRFKRTT